MDYLEHSYNAYLRELLRRDELRRALGLPMGVTVLLGGAWYTLIGKLGDYVALNVLGWAFVGLAVTGIVTLIAGGIFLVRSHVGYKYAYMPTAKEILDYSEQLVEYYEAENRWDARIGEEIDEYLTEQFADDAHENALNNNAKAKHLHNANLRLVASIGLLVGAGGVELLLRIGG